MPQYPQQMRVPTAVSDRSKFDLSGDNVTTSDIFKIKPSFVKELVPDDSFDIDVETLIRSYPIAVPTFGRYTHHNRFFWVPTRTIMQGWNEFIEGSPYQPQGGTGSVIIKNVPYFRNSDVVAFFLNSITVESTPVSGHWCRSLAPSSSEVPDAIINISNDGLYGGFDVNYEDLTSSDIQNLSQAQIAGTSKVAVRFTREGRAFVDLLQNLGYNINWSLFDQRKMSALPLLAYFRVFADYYVSPQFVSGIQHFFSLTSGNIFNDIDRFDEIVYQWCPGFSCYDPDYFVSAWNNPASPNNSQWSDVPYQVDINHRLSGFASVVQGDGTTSDKGNPIITNKMGPNSPITTLSQYILNRLRATANFAYRNNIAGYRFWDRLKAEYGVVMDYKEKGTSLYIDTVSTPIKISEVVSSADTEQAPLGDLAGKGFGYSEPKHIHFESNNEYGFLICVSTIVPYTGYVQGTVRENTHLERMDFFHGDYDQQGTQAIEKSELYSSAFVGEQLFDISQQSTPKFDDDFDPQGVFRWTPIYSEYKRGTSVLSGDFRVNSRASQGAINAYHAFRIVANEFDSDLDQVSSLLRPTLAFIQGDNSQFDRIFANTDPNFDHFQIIHHFECHATRKMKSLAEQMADDEALRHNDKTELQTGGTMFN